MFAFAVTWRMDSWIPIARSIARAVLLWGMSTPAAAGVCNWVPYELAGLMSHLTAALVLLFLSQNS